MDYYRNHRKCCVPSCSWELARNRTIYYPFPSNEKMKQKWVTALNMSYDESVLNSYVCAAHFEANELANIDENTTAHELIAIKQESGLVDTNFEILSIEPLLIDNNRIKEEIKSEKEIEDYFDSYEFLDPSNLLDNKIEIPVQKLIRLKDNGLSSKSNRSRVGLWSTHSKDYLNGILPKSSENQTKYIMNIETTEEIKRRKTRERVQRWRAKKTSERVTNLTHQSISNSRRKRNEQHPNLVNFQSTAVMQEMEKRMTKTPGEQRLVQSSLDSTTLTNQNALRKTKSWAAENRRQNNIIIKNEVKLNEEDSSTITDEIKQNSEFNLQASSSMISQDEDYIKIEIDDGIGYEDNFGHNTQILDSSSTLDNENSCNWINMNRCFMHSTHANVTEATVSEHHSMITTKMETPEERKRRMTRERVQRWRAKKYLERMEWLCLQNSHMNMVNHNAERKFKYNDHSAFNSIMETREERNKRLTRERVKRWRARQLAKRNQNYNDLSKTNCITKKNAVKQKYKLVERNFLTLNRTLNLNVNQVKNEIIEMEDYLYEYFEPFGMVDPLAISDDEIEMPVPKLIKLEYSSADDNS